MLNTRLLGYAQKDQRKDVFEAVWWQKELIRMTNQKSRKIPSS